MRTPDLPLLLQARRGPHRDAIRPGKTHLGTRAQPWLPLWVDSSPHCSSLTQVLASLRSVRSNFSLLTNVPIPSNK